MSFSNFLEQLFRDPVFWSVFAISFALLLCIPANRCQKMRSEDADHHQFQRILQDPALQAPREWHG